MRRTAVVMLLAAVIVAWLAPVTAARGAGSNRSHWRISETKKHGAHGKKTPTPVPHHKTRKHKKHKARKPTPRPTARPHKTATPRPRATNTALPAPVITATPTATATLIPTPTLTPTPVPLTASLALQSDVSSGYTAAFFVCGLPPGATATFSPNPATSRSDMTSPTYASVQTVATVSVPFTVTPNSYGLTFYAYYRDGRGMIPATPPGGVITPRYAVLTVQHTAVSLQPAAAVPADSGQGCSSIPAGYQPSPEPTPGTADYSLTTWVSDSHPAPGETVTAYGQLTFHGQPVFGAAMNFDWYSYGVTRAPCYVVTDPTGTASCSVVNSYPLAGVPVTIQVTALYNNLTFNGWTSYTM